MSSHGVAHGAGPGRPAPAHLDHAGRGVAGGGHPDRVGSCPVGSSPRRSLLAGGCAISPGGLGSAPAPAGLLRGAGRHATCRRPRPHSGRPAQRRAGLLGTAGATPPRYRLAQRPGPDGVGAHHRGPCPGLAGDRARQHAIAAACPPGTTPARHCRAWSSDDPAHDTWHDCLIWAHTT
jgi:hypothetical protein